MRALPDDPATLPRLIARERGWMPLKMRPGIGRWTDDYATILPLLKGL